MGNVGIYSVGTENVYQIAQSGKKKCFMSVSWECLTHELFAKHSCLHHFAGCLVTHTHTHTHTHSLSLSLSFSLSQPLQLNPTINIWYKILNKITIKFVTELKPTKQIVVNYNFTISPFGYSMIKLLKQTLKLNVSLGIVAKLTHT